MDFSVTQNQIVTKFEPIKKKLGYVVSLVKSTFYLICNLVTKLFNNNNNIYI